MLRGTGAENNRARADSLFGREFTTMKMGDYMTKIITMLTIMVILLMLVIELNAQNSMPLMQSFQGEWAESWYGVSLDAIDFNADGYDDLVIYSRGSVVPDHWPYVKVFFGGNTMDSEADLFRAGDFAGQVINNVMMNAGDLNGDGFDDLMISERYAYMVNDSLALRIFHGGPDADLVPDDSLNTAVINSHPAYEPIWRLGDVNGDGYDDLGLRHWFNTSTPDLAILLGGSFEIITVQPSVTTNRGQQINGVGDVNNDGYDDFVVAYAIRIQNVLTTFRYLYYGGNPINLDNRVLLRSLADDGEWMFPGAYNGGDFNGDGYDDFVYCNGNSWREYNKLRLGALDIMSSDEFALTVSTYQPNLMYIETKGTVHGDFNGDGYSDIAGSDYRSQLWHGNAGIWLGKPNPNGLYDLRLTPPDTSPFHQFGWSLAAGDFNGDGFCDLAVSAPNAQNSDPWYLGYVYIFTGNPQLTDTTVANDDECLPSASDSIRIRCYPNPLDSASGAIRYEIEGDLPANIESVVWTVHNIKGQIVHRQVSDRFDSQNKSGSLEPQRLVPGVYVISLRINGKRVSSGKITIR